MINGMDLETQLVNWTFPDGLHLVDREVLGRAAATKCFFL